MCLLTFGIRHLRANWTFGFKFFHTRVYKPCANSQLCKSCKLFLWSALSVCVAKWVRSHAIMLHCMWVWWAQIQNLRQAQSTKPSFLQVSVNWYQFVYSGWPLVKIVKFKHLVVWLLACGLSSWMGANYQKLVPSVHMGILRISNC
jgi:hypothetical protein